MEKVKQQYIVRANKGRPRIWIEGKRLAGAGFINGVNYNIESNGDFLTILTSANGSRRVSGRTDRPIIDITGASCGPFKTGDAVSITYYEKGAISIARVIGGAS